ncbi:MAG: hypothetical protein ALECFALPRED_006506 [Alectoria fallacina]|uniref:Uncharacterized protein n=1 Tax=Alectoria fallacina TaxID=1903189 RepID=A0A8H3IZN5_9LECA|nr:MAG: hypothetical protein ALECFALPRED_006506 [Alectoria fallacina]
MASNKTNRVLENLEANTVIERPSNTPFTDYSVDQVYHLYKAHLQTIHKTDRDQFTDFTILVVDETCVRSSAKQCVLWYDAPDYNETDKVIKLERMHIPVEKVMPTLYALEQ